MGHGPAAEAEKHVEEDRGQRVLPDDGIGQLLDEEGARFAPLERVVPLLARRRLDDGVEEAEARAQVVVVGDVDVGLARLVHPPPLLHLQRQQLHGGLEGARLEEKEDVLAGRPTQLALGHVGAIVTVGQVEKLADSGETVLRAVHLEVVDEAHDVSASAGETELVPARGAVERGGGGGGGVAKGLLEARLELEFGVLEFGDFRVRVEFGEFVEVSVCVGVFEVEVWCVYARV